MKWEDFSALVEAALELSARARKLVSLVSEILEAEVDTWDIGIVEVHRAPVSGTRGDHS